MLALAQAAMTDARLLLIDEASLGLAPKLVAALFEVVVRFRQDGRSILLVEQNANLALDVADRAYVMEKGRLHETGAAGVVEQDRLAELYLGDEAVTPR
jgi:branched-chain amino acid transport system ATP-binding protein